MREINKTAYDQTLLPQKVSHTDIDCPQLLDFKHEDVSLSSVIQHGMLDIGGHSMERQGRGLGSHSTLKPVSMGDSYTK